MSMIPEKDVNEIEWYELYPRPMREGFENVCKVNLVDGRRWVYVQDRTLRQELLALFNGHYVITPA